MPQRVVVFFPLSERLRSLSVTYAHISDFVQTVYELPLTPNNTAVKHFYTNRERCEVLTGCLSLGTGQAVNGRIRDIGQNVVQSSFKQEVTAATVTAMFSSLSHSSSRPLLEI